MAAPAHNKPRPLTSSASSAASASSSSASSFNGDEEDGDGDGGLYVKVSELPDHTRQQLRLLFLQTADPNCGAAGAAGEIPLFEPRPLSAQPTIDEIQMCFAQVDLMILMEQANHRHGHGHVHKQKQKQRASIRPPRRPRSTPPIPSCQRPRSSAAAGSWPSPLPPPISALRRPQSCAALRHKPKPKPKPAPSSWHLQCCIASSDSQEEEDDDDDDEGEEEEGEDCGFGSRKEGCPYPIRADILDTGDLRDGHGHGHEYGHGHGDGRVRPAKMRQLLAEMEATERSIAAAKAEVEALAREEAVAGQKLVAGQKFEEEEAGGPRPGPRPAPPPRSNNAGNTRANAIDPANKKKIMKKNERTIQMPVWTPSGSRGKAVPRGHARHYANHCTFRSEEEFDIFRSPPGKKK